MGKSHRASFTMRFLGMSLLAIVLAATVHAEDFTKEKIQLGKKKCLCDFSLDVAEKCKGTAKCDKKCSGSGEVEIGGCSFTLVVKKGKGKISKCSCETAPTLPPTETTTNTGSGSGETPVPITGSGSEEPPMPITGSGSGPMPITGSGSGAPPAGGEGMQCSCKCDCPDGSGECDCDCNCPMTSKAVNCAPGFSKVCPMMGDACPQDMEPICPNNAMSRMAGGAGDGHMADRGCQCVPDFLVDMVKIQPLAPAGRMTAVDRAMTKATIQVGKKKCKCSYEMNADNCKKSKITCDKKCSGKASGVELADGMYMLDIAVKKGKVTIAKCDAQAAPAPTGTGGGSGGGMGSGSGNGGGGTGGIGSRCACVSVGMGGTGPVTPTGSGSGTVPTGSGSGPATILPPTGSGSGSGYEHQYVSENKLILKFWHLLDKKLVLDAGAGTSRETIEWTQISKCSWTCSEDYILADYHEDGDKSKPVIKVFVAKDAGSPPESLSTAGHSGTNGAKLHFGNVFFSDTMNGSAIFFVLHPNKWGPYQHRFKTSSLTNAFHATVNAIVGSGVAAGVGAGIAAAAASGAAMGSFLPGPGTAAVAVLGVAVGTVIGTLSDDYIGNYLRYIG